MIAKIHFKSGAVVMLPVVTGISYLKSIVKVNDKIIKLNKILTITYRNKQ